MRDSFLIDRNPAPLLLGQGLLTQSCLPVCSWCGQGRAHNRHGARACARLDLRSALAAVLGRALLGHENDAPNCKDIGSTQHRDGDNHQ